VTREWVRKIEIRALRKLNDDEFKRLVPTKLRPRRVQPTDGLNPEKSSRPAHPAATLKQTVTVAISNRFSGRAPLATGGRKSQTAKRSVAVLPTS